MSSDVIYHTSDETGAPPIDGNANSLIAVLDAFLVNGFNAKSVISLSVAAGVATASISAHGYRVGRKIQIAGADTTAANGVKKVLSASTNSLTFDATGIADGTITGTITSKSAPLGWTKLFGDTSQGIYKRKDVTARAMLLRVIDNAATIGGHCALFGMVDSATDMNSFINLVPVIGHGGYVPDGNIVRKTISPGGGGSWTLIGDGTSFYLFTGNFTVNGYGFGDVKAFRSDDTTASFIIADRGADAAYFIAQSLLGSGIGVISAFMSRSFDGTAASVNFSYPLLMNSSRIAGTDSAQFPSPYDNGVAVIEDFPIFEGNYIKPVARGSMPGIAIPFAPVAYVAGVGAIVQGAGGSGKEYLAVLVDTTNGHDNVNSSNFLFDITGPWQ